MQMASVTSLKQHSTKAVHRTSLTCISADYLFSENYSFCLLKAIHVSQLYLPSRLSQLSLLGSSVLNYTCRILVENHKTRKERNYSSFFGLYAQSHFFRSWTRDIYMGYVNLDEIGSDCFQTNFIFQPVNFKMEYQ